jgi:hypothetical protein
LIAARGMAAASTQCPLCPVSSLEITELAG